MFTRLRNLARIAKAYGLIRDGIERRRRTDDSRYWADLLRVVLSITEVQEMLKGYKTYILAAAIGALTVAKALGYVDEASYNTLAALLGAGAAGTLAAKINRIGA